MKVIKCKSLALLLTISLVLLMFPPVQVLATNRYEETHPSITYSGTWGTYSNSNSSGGTQKWTLTAGSSATFAFNGAEVAWIISKNNNYGIAKVYIDDVYDKDVDLYSATTVWQQVVYTRTGLSSGVHRIKIEAAGRNPSSSNYYVGVDAFETDGTAYLPAPSITSINPTSRATGTQVTITGSNFQASQGSSTVTFNGVSATPTRYEDNSSSLSYVWEGPWQSVSDSNASGGTLKTSSVGGSSVSFLFNDETLVSWIATQGPSYGTANVYLDGVLRGSVSLNNSVKTYRRAVYTEQVLTAGPHVVKLVTVGDKPISVDAFDSGGGAPANDTFWTDDKVQVTVPLKAFSGPVVVTTAGGASNGVNFTIAAPSISGIEPTSGSAGTSVTISGTDFGIWGQITFSSTAATISSWSNTSITTQVPSAATSGSVVVTTPGGPSNSVNFTVPTPTSTSAPSAPTGFAATPGNTTIALNWNGSDGATGYKVYYAAKSAAFGSPLDVGNLTSYTLTGLSNGTIYYIAVTAYNSAGESSQSSIVSATPSAAAAGTSAKVAGATTGLGEIVGRVVNRAWQTIPGTAVRINATVVPTNPGGEFRFTLVAAGVYMVYYDAPGYIGQTQMIEVRTGQSTRCPTVIMDPGATPSVQGEIFGRVVNPAHQPLAWAAVRINNIVIPTNAAGEFRFTLVNAGVYTVYYDAAGYAGQTQMLEVKAGMVTYPPMVILSGTLGEIYGRVLDIGTRRAIPGTAVRVNSSVMPTNPGGEFRFTLVHPGIYKVYYDAPGYKGQIQEVIAVFAGTTTICPTVLMSR